MSREARVPEQGGDGAGAKKGHGKDGVCVRGGGIQVIRGAQARRAASCRL